MRTLILLRLTLTPTLLILNTCSNTPAGIPRSSTWVQPAAQSNGYDSFTGIDAFTADPMGVPPKMVPMGITFPSMKVTAITAITAVTTVTYAITFPSMKDTPLHHVTVCNGM